MQIVSRSSSQDSFKNRDYDCYRLYLSYISILYVLILIN